MEPNKVTLYSSGMADFVRVYAAQPGKATTISIPVREEHIGDVLDSLKVYGAVRLVAPPSFTPTNANAGVLQISSESAQEDLFTKLSGSSITLNVRGQADPIEGRLVGMDSRDRKVNEGSVVSEKLVTIECNGKIRKFIWDDIMDFEFTDHKAQSEIKKALDANFHRIKEGSTFLELTVQPLDAELVPVLVQYMIPMAAPKSTYRLSQGKDSQGKEHQARLELLAVVDNNTDDDMEDFLVTIANGQPITFTTDLASIRLPARGHRNVVADTALGALDMEEGYEYNDAVGASAAPRLAARTIKGGAVMRSMAMGLEASSYSSPSPISAAYDGSRGPGQISQAVRDEAEAVEVGDFQLFASKTSMTIPSKKSALVSLFSQDLPTSRSVVIYRPNQHPQRGFRAVRFTNTTGFSLSKGVCSVFQDGVNVGKGIMEDSKPDDVTLIPHQLETGIRFTYQQYPAESRMTHVNIANGTYLSETMSTVRSNWTIRNKKDEEYRLYLEYTSAFGHSSGSEFEIDAHPLCDKRIEKIPSGWRAAITLQPNANITVSGKETLKGAQAIQLSDSNFFGYFNSTESLKNNPLIQKCFIIQERITKTQDDIRESEVNKAASLEQTGRVSGYIKNAPEGSQRDTWVKDIADTEAEIRSIDRSMRTLAGKLKEHKAELRDTLKQISADWYADMMAHEAAGSRR